MVVLRKMRGTPLLVTALAWSWFYAVGSILLAIVPMLREPLALSGTLGRRLAGCSGHWYWSWRGLLLGWYLDHGFAQDLFCLGLLA